jgi:hypothetical protein
MKKVFPVVVLSTTPKERIVMAETEKLGATSPRQNPGRSHELH